jgi:hypothetical protein
MPQSAKLALRNAMLLQAVAAVRWGRAGLPPSALLPAPRCRRLSTTSGRCPQSCDQIELKHGIATMF